MAKFRSAIVSCLTFVTTRRAVDLTSATATKGNDVDPDIAVICRRAIAARRAIAKDKEAKKLMEEILKCYEEKGEPAFLGTTMNSAQKGQQVSRRTREGQRCAKHAGHEDLLDSCWNRCICRGRR